MRTSKVAISIDRELIEKLDKLVENQVFPSRSRAIQQAIIEKLMRFERVRLATECAKLNTRVEQAMAEEGMTEELSRWPEY